VGNCNHEAADTWVVVHVLHALELRADTNVIVILVGQCRSFLPAQPLTDICLAFGMGKNYRFYHINAICASLRQPASRALPVFNACCGCDTTSSFNGKGKKSAWQAWQAYEDDTETFVYLANNSLLLVDADAEPFEKLERLLVCMTKPVL